MRIEVGVSATVSTTLVGTYQCSRCKKQVQAIVSMDAVGGANSFFGETAGDARDYARENLQKKLEGLRRKKPRDYKAAKIDCRCTYCGHREPWAKYYHPRLDKIMEKGWMGFIYTALLFFVGWLLMKRGDTGTARFVMMIPSVCFLLGPCVGIGLLIYHTVLGFKIRSLPPESLPDF